MSHRSKYSDDLLLSTASKNITNVPQVRKTRLKAIEKLDPVSLSNYAGAVVDAIDNNIISLRPDIDSKLVTIHSGEIKDLFECGIRERLEKTAANNKIKIPVGKTKRRGNSRCVNATSEEARNEMLDNFRKEGKLNPALIISPMQFHTNCWFNTMFMCLFISDKGRKFMRFFRQLMIQGKTINDVSVTPEKLNEALVLLNLAIEACYNLSQSSKNIGLALNTNNIIHGIYSSIPDSYKTEHAGIRDVDQYGNPYHFYNDLINYLTNSTKETTKMITLKNKDDVSNFYDGTARINTEVIAIQVTDSGVSDRATPSDAKSMPMEISLLDATYVLDSFIARDIDKNHFCCGIKINGKEYVFDGAAFSPLSKRKWSSKLGKNANWSVPGSSSTWNFSKGYSILMYYKIA